jgi:hypothetical protein
VTRRARWVALELSGCGVDSSWVLDMPIQRTILITVPVFMIKSYAYESYAQVVAGVGRMSTSGVCSMALPVGLSISALSSTACSDLLVAATMHNPM